MSHYINYFSLNIGLSAALTSSKLTLSISEDTRTITKLFKS